MKQNFAQQLLHLYNTFPNKEIIHVFCNREYHHIDYQTLLRRASAFQKNLQKNNIKPGDVVIIILEHSIELIYAYFGCVLNGSIPSIMPYLTEKLIPEKYRQDLASLFEITHPECVITFKDFSNDADILQSEKSIQKTVIFIEDIASEISKINPEISDFPGIERHGSSIALLQHSSGTTGLQKGVALSHRAIINQLESYAEALRINKNDVIVSWLPLYHDMGLIAGFLMPIFMGVPLVIMSPFDWVRAPYLLMQAVSAYSGTLCWLPNFAYNFCAKKIRERDMEGVELTSLRAVINCSEPMRKTSHEMFLNKFKPYGFNPSAIATSYAMAENVFAVTQGGIDEPINYDLIELIPFQEQRKAIPYNGSGPSLSMVSAGKPITEVYVKILGPNGNDLPERHIGEIVINSNCLFNGYYKREDATRTAFHDGWFLTGDYGYMAEGELYITGRKKDLIIIGGKNIYPKDIETIAMEVDGVHPGRVVAFGIFNETKGTEDVVLIVEIEDSHLDRKAEIAATIRQKVTKESAIALRKVLAVPKKWLIKTSSGKIARSLNKEKYIKEITQTL